MDFNLNKGYFNQTFSIIIDNTAPSPANPAIVSPFLVQSGIQTACYINSATTPGGAPAFNPTLAASYYSDNCPGTLTATLVNTIVTGNNCSWELSYIFNISDSCGNTRTNQVLKYTGGDGTPPVFNTCPGNLTLQSTDSIPAASLVTATDNCGNTLTVNLMNTASYLEIPFGLLNKPGYCPDSLYRYYIVQDGCLNRDTCFQKILVLNDTTCEICQQSVNYYQVDLTSSPSASATLLNLERKGLCCNETSPSRCIAFNMQLHPNTAGLMIEIQNGGVWTAQGQIQAGEWNLNCSPGIFNGTIMCLSGATIFTLTHCKPGGNDVGYRFTAYEGMAVSPGWTIRKGCTTSKTVTVSGVYDTSVVFHDLTGNGQYLSYLSHPTGSLTTTFNPDSLAPSTISYAVCGSLNQTSCSGGTQCDTITFYIVDPIGIQLIIPPVICPDNPLAVYATAYPYSNLYQYYWYSGHDSTGQLLQTGGNYFLPNTSGPYSVVAVDISSGLDCNTALRNFDITFDTLGPDIIAPDTLHIDCHNSDINGTIWQWLNTASASDPNNATYSLAISHNYSPFPIYCGSTQQVVFYVSDSCGNISSDTSYIIVYDSIKPVITSAGMDTTIHCLDIPYFTSPNIIDLCDPNPVLSSFDLITPGLCATSYILTRYWWGQDACGNLSDTVHQSVTVIDTIPPYLFGGAVPVQSTVACLNQAAPPLILPTIIDDCEGVIQPPTPIINDTPNPIVCNGTRRYTYNYADCMGNTLSWYYTYTIEYQPFPVIPPSFDTVDCVASIVLPQLPLVVD
ncbi:MAG TPA: hypothetical protein P5338_09970, partial [Bacteroidales bacterium]|nr:hypothetical protein [Bacteroidales bacterium]